MISEFEHRIHLNYVSTVNFSGSCGLPSGGCPPLGVGGGNLSLEQCSIRPATCIILPPPPPPCDSNTKCCQGDSHPTNPNCPEKVNGVCSANGCAHGVMTPSSGEDWICKGVNGGTDTGKCTRSIGNDTTTPADPDPDPDLLTLTLILTLTPDPDPGP